MPGSRKARLGKRQLDTLAMMAGVQSALVVPDKLTRSLEANGMMVSLSEHETGGFLALTPAAYREVADALESGRIVRPPLTQWGKSKEENRA